MSQLNLGVFVSGGGTNLQAIIDACEGGRIEATVTVVVSGKVSDDQGNVDYDFAVVQTVDNRHPDRLPPSIHAAYWPTRGIQPGDPITLKVRSFRSNGGEVWDFGDGSPAVRVKSDGNAVKLAKDGYAVTTHRFQTAGHHIVRVQHTSPLGLKATAHLHVVVDP